MASLPPSPGRCGTLVPCSPTFDSSWSRSSRWAAPLPNSRRKSTIKPRNCPSSPVVFPLSHLVARAKPRDRQSSSKCGRTRNSDGQNHLISGFCCTDSEWPLQLWNNLTKQALITLNLCRTSRKYPDKSTCHSFYGKGMIGTNTQWRHPRREP